MNNLARALLLAGALVLALLVGVLIGRGQRPAATQTPAPAMQINTTPPPPPMAAVPLPAPVQAPKPASVPKIAPDLQVQEDAAAVGMTTRPVDEDAPAAPTTDGDEAQPAG
jgi:hypothetical protein